MVRFFHFGFSKSSGAVGTTTLAVAMGLGFLSGPLVAAQLPDNGFYLIECAAGNRVGFLSLLSVSVLPFLFTAAAAYIRHFWLLLPFAYMKAFAFSYFCACILHVYGASGWIVLVMLLFTDLLTMPLLCWVWISILEHGPKVLLHRLSFAFIPLFLITFLDFSYISPYLANLLS